MSTGKRIALGYFGSFVGLLILGAASSDDVGRYEAYVTHLGTFYFWLAVLIGAGYLFFRRAR